MPKPVPIESLATPLAGELRQLWEEFPELTLLQFMDNEALVDSGDTGDHFYLLLKGSCLVEWISEGDSGVVSPSVAVLHGDMEQPVFIGEMAALGGGDRSATVRSAMSTWVIRLEAQHLDVLLDRFPGLTRGLCRQMVTRLRETGDSLHILEELLSLPAERRLSVPGEVLFERGMKATKLYHLVDGAVQLGDEERTWRVQAGEGPCLLEAGAFFRDDHYRLHAAVVVPSVLMVIDAAHRVDAIRRFPEVVATLLENEAGG